MAESAPVISYLELTNYRGFERYRLSGLARVNLLVGRNNSGKTSILEAINLLDATENPSLLSRTSAERGEIVPAPDEDGRIDDFVDVFHLFHGREPRPGDHLAIQADDRRIKISLDFIDEDKIRASKDFDRIRRYPSPNRARPGSLLSPPPVYSLSIENGTPAEGEAPLFLATEEGALISEPVRFRRARWRHGNASQFITAGSLGADSMKVMWDKVNIDGRQSEVIEAMQILEPELKDLFFLAGDRSGRYDSKGGIFAALRGRSRRVPLGSYGEGMRRILALSLALACTQGDILLIDEIDTGLHYSIMGELWQMVVGAARRNNVQVFATTHSLDCVRGLAWLCEHYSELGEEVSLQKIEPVLEEAVAFDARGIRIAAEQDIEVR